MKKKNFKKLFAFTLAEVLITLSILGVVAAITVPSLINRQNEKEFVTKLKKEYSALQTAFDIAVAENGPIERWDSNYNGVALEKILHYMNVSKICYDDDLSCSPTANYKTLTNKNSTDNMTTFTDAGTRRAVLKDGTYIEQRNTAGLNSKNCNNGVKNACSQILIDLNGNKGPNKWGVDAFGMDLTRTGFIPYGGSDGYNPMTTLCRSTATHGQNGLGCTAWALYKGNMDYLRKNVSWD